VQGEATKSKKKLPSVVVEVNVSDIVICEKLGRGGSGASVFSVLVNGT